MSTFKNIQGKNIRSYTTNAPNAKAGEMWYNQSELKLKGVVAIGAWSSSSPLTTGRAQAGGNGIQTAALMCGGYTTAVTALTEEYGGSGWAAGGNLTTSRSSLRSAGTQTSAIAFGGYKPSPGYITVTESYNGTSWTNSPSLNTGRTGGSQAGTSTAALYAGGGTPGTITNSEEYDGSSWSEGNNLNTARTVVGGSGIQTAALAAGGELGPPGYTGATENYDGTSWTTSPASLNVIKGGQGQNGTQTSSLAYGGYTGTAATGATESWDGTSWTNLSPIALATARNATQGAGADNTSAVCFGGDPQKKDTEEYNFTANTITAAAWSSGGNLNTAREQGGTAGTTPAGIYMTGKVYPNTFKNETEEYNGTSWSEQNNVSTARTASGAGTQTAGLIFGGTNGAPGSTGVQSATEEYDGSSWTNGGSLSAARLGMYGAGLQTAAFGAGGIISTNAAVTTVEDYNGSAWTSGTAIPSAQQGGGSAGLPSARLIFGGYSPYSAVTLEGDGEGWTAGGNMNQARGILAGFGSQTDAIAAGGSVNPNANSALAEGYDGTSWSTRPSLATARMSFSPSGAYNTTTGGFVAGGSQQGNPQNAQTEEWNAETTSVNIVDITTS